MRELHRAILVPESNLEDVERFLADLADDHDPNFR